MILKPLYDTSTYVLVEGNSRKLCGLVILLPILKSRNAYSSINLFLLCRIELLLCTVLKEVGISVTWMLSLSSADPKINLEQAWKAMSGLLHL